MSNTRFYYDHASLGRVLITVRNDARRFVARWKADGVHLTVPSGATRQAVTEALDSMAPRLLQSRPTLIYHDGMVIDVDGLRIDIHRQSMFPDKINISATTASEAHIGVGASMDFDSPAVQKSISDGLKIIAGHHAPAILLPQARAIAERLGLKPRRWSIGRGDRRLGCCNSHGEISLSRICVFLTPELREYIICHELAHLTEMNHSPRFHQLCNHYLGGREAHLISRLHSYRWPILK